MCLDEVSGLGVFLELEALERLDAPGLVGQAALVDLVAELGLEMERVEETYDSLLHAAAAR
jgi:adenylate cyclase class 2